MTDEAIQVRRDSAVRVSVVPYEPEVALRIVVLLGLLGVALVHLLDLPGTITSSPVQGTLYLLLIAGCLVTDFLLLHGTSLTR
jgi:hypothetical protein